MLKRVLVLAVSVFLSAVVFTLESPSQTGPSPADCSRGERVFAEDFSAANSGWKIGASSTGADWAYTDDDQYRVFVTNAQWIAWTSAPFSAGQLPANFCLAVDVKLLVQGSLSDDGSMGMLFAGNPVLGSNANFTTFEVHPRSGTYVITRFTRGNGKFSLRDLVKFTKSDAIEGVNKVNRLLMLVQDGLAHFFINGTLVTSLTTSTSGGIGVVTESFDEPNVNGRFDNFTVTRL